MIMRQAGYLRLYSCMITALIFLVLGGCSQDVKIPENVLSVSKVSQQEKVVRAFMQAFNDHDIERMVTLCREDVVWGYVEQSDYNKSGQSVLALQDELSSYFTATPTARSDIEGLIVNGDYVSVVERVYWQMPAEAVAKTEEAIEDTQSALSVYHVIDNKIQAVWYFPVQP